MGQFLTAEEVGEIMGYSASHSYSIIRELNSEAESQGLHNTKREGSRVSISLSVSVWIRKEQQRTSQNR